MQRAPTTRITPKGDHKGRPYELRIFDTDSDTDPDAERLKPVARPPDGRQSLLKQAVSGDLPDERPQGAAKP